MISYLSNKTIALRFHQTAKNCAVSLFAFLRLLAKAIVLIGLVMLGQQNVVFAFEPKSENEGTAIYIEQFKIDPLIRDELKQLKDIATLILSLNFSPSNSESRLTVMSKPKAISYKISGKFELMATQLERLRLRVYLETYSKPTTLDFKQSKDSKRTTFNTGSEASKYLILDNYLVPSDGNLLSQLEILLNETVVAIEQKAENNVVKFVIGCFSYTNENEKNDEYLANKAQKLLAFTLEEQLGKITSIRTDLLPEETCEIEGQGQDFLLSANIKDGEKIVVYPKLSFPKAKGSSERAALELFPVEVSRDFLEGGKVDDRLAKQISKIIQYTVDNPEEWLNSINLTKKTTTKEAVKNGRKLYELGMSSNKDLSLAEYVSQQAENISKDSEASDLITQAEASLLLGKIYIVEEKNEKALNYLQSAVRIFEGIVSQSSSSDSLHSTYSELLLASKLAIAEILYNQGFYVPAELAYEKALKASNTVNVWKEKIPENLHGAFANYAWSSFKNEHFEKSAETYESLLESDYQEKKNAAQFLLTAVVRGKNPQQAEQVFDKIVGIGVAGSTEKECDDLCKIYVDEIRLASRRHFERNGTINFQGYINDYNIINAREKSAKSAFEEAIAYSIYAMEAEKEHLEVTGKENKIGLSKVLFALNQFVQRSLNELNAIKVDETQKNVENNSVDKRDLLQLVSRFHLGRVFQVETQIYYNGQPKFRELPHYARLKLRNLALMVMDEDDYASLLAFDAYYRAIAQILNGVSEQEFAKRITKLKNLPIPADFVYGWGWQDIVDYIEINAQQNPQKKKLVRFIKEQFEL